MNRESGSGVGRGDPDAPNGFGTELESGRGERIDDAIEAYNYGPA